MQKSLANGIDYLIDPNMGGGQTVVKKVTVNTKLRIE
jgi:hypothetical protein